MVYSRKGLWFSVSKCDKIYSLYSSNMQLRLWLLHYPWLFLNRSMCHSPEGHTLHTNNGIYLIDSQYSRPSSCMSHNKVKDWVTAERFFVLLVIRVIKQINKSIRYKRIHTGSVHFSQAPPFQGKSWNATSTWTDQIHPSEKCSVCRSKK